MLNFKFNNFNRYHREINFLLGVFCLVTFASCGTDIAEMRDCGTFLKGGKQSHLLLKEFGCQNRGPGITHFKFSGVLGLNSVNARELDDGIKSTRLNLFPAEQKNINILVIDQISNPNLEISIAKCAKPWSEVPDEGGNPTGRRCTLREFAEQEKGALFVINGGYFHYSYNHYKRYWDRTKQNYEIGDPVGFLKINNNIFAQHPYAQEPFKENWGIFSLRKSGDFPAIGNMASNIDTKSLLKNPNVLTAAPIFYRNSVAVPMNRVYQETMRLWPGSKDSPGMLKHIPANAARTAIGIDVQGRLYIFNVDGKIPGVSSGMKLEEVASVMGTLGLIDAMGLDGGGSAGIFDVENNTYLNEGLKLKERPIGTALIVKRRAVPYRIRQLLNEDLLAHGVYPHKDYRVIHPKNIESHLDPASDVPIASLNAKYREESTKYYVTKETDKKIYRMKIEKGIIINPNDNKPASGLGKYVFSKDDELFIAFVKKNEVFPTVEKDGTYINDSLSNPGDAITVVDKSEPELEFKHSYFTEGEPVLSGGWIEVQRGKIKCIDNHSGHYRPTWSFFKYFLRKMIYDFRVDFNDAMIYSYAIQHAPQHSLCWEMKLPFSK